MINNKKLANGVNDNEQSKKVSWWINELDSLGIEKSSSSNDNEVIAAVSVFIYSLLILLFQTRLTLLKV
jgi:hypothetical protein